MSCVVSVPVHPVSSIFATFVGIDCTFLQEIHVGINYHGWTSDNVVIFIHDKPVGAAPQKQCFTMEAVPYFVSYGTYCCI